ncbi:MAG: dihydrofolate reductase family protein [Bacteroidota bacterium]|nr:dihydrofolate reductase family protein [Bacteroidota bacterium]
MRKLKLQVQMSIDGYMAGPNDEMDWLEWNWDDELKNYVTRITETIDCILLGRKLAEGFINTWATRAEDPDSTDSFAHKMQDTPKIVFTRSIYKADWQNTTLESGDIVEEVVKLKNQEGRDIMVYGGGTLVRTLIEASLIDELHLFVNPTALGCGMPVFGSFQKMKLLTSRPFDCGIVVLIYGPQRKS